MTVAGHWLRWGPREQLPSRILHLAQGEDLAMEQRGRQPVGVRRVELLRRRDHPATAAAEHTAHDEVGAELLWLAADAEARLRDVLPDN